MSALNFLQEMIRVKLQNIPANSITGGVLSEDLYNDILTECYMRPNTPFIIVQGMRFTKGEASIVPYTVREWIWIPGVNPNEVRVANPFATYDYTTDNGYGGELIDVMFD